MSDDPNKTNDEAIVTGDTDEDEPMYITLEFDDDVVMETEVMGVFESDGKEYIALLPDDGSDDVYIYGYKENPRNEDEFELIDIEDDKEFEKAVAAFEALMGEE